MTKRTKSECLSGSKRKCDVERNPSHAEVPSLMTRLSPEDSLCSGPLHTHRKTEERATSHDGTHTRVNTTLWNYLSMFQITWSPDIGSALANGQQPQNLKQATNIKCIVSERSIQSRQTRFEKVSAGRERRMGCSHLNHVYEAYNITHRTTKVENNNANKVKASTMRNWCATEIEASSKMKWWTTEFERDSTTKVRQ